MTKNEMVKRVLKGIRDRLLSIRREGYIDNNKDTIDMASGCIRGVDLLLLTGEDKHGGA